MTLEKRRLTEIDKNLIIQLLGDPLIKKYMPLSAEVVGESQYTDFIAAKEAIWEKYGFGPWAYLMNNQFIGWAGIQPDGTDFELALVLSSKYWGYGKQIYQDLIQEAFEKLNLDSVTILFPPSRTRIRGVFKAGFLEEGPVMIDGECFVRFRLNNLRLKQFST